MISAHPSQKSIKVTSKIDNKNIDWLSLCELIIYWCICPGTYQNDYDNYNHNDI